MVREVRQRESTMEVVTFSYIGDEVTLFRAALEYMTRRGAPWDVSLTRDDQGAHLTLYYEVGADG